MSIGFKGKRFYLGTYKNYQEAVSVRLNAEEQVHDKFVQAYYIWKNEEEPAEGDQKEKQPLIFDVEMVNGDFRITTNVKV